MKDKIISHNQGILKMTMSKSLVFEKEQINKVPLSVHFVKKKYQSAVASLEFTPLLGGSRFSINSSDINSPRPPTIMKSMNALHLPKYLETGLEGMKNLIGTHIYHLFHGHLLKYHHPLKTY